MKETLATLQFYPRHDPRMRLFALWYFTILLIIGTFLGHSILGFEQAWAHHVVSLGAAVATHVFLEWVDARSKGRPLRFSGSAAAFINFLPPAIIPGLAIATLLYPNDRLWPVAFAAALSIASKVLVRAPVGNLTQHVFNPSNFGMTATLLVLPFVGVAPPYHFTEGITGTWDWIAPGILLTSGIVIHALFTGRLVLVMAWIAGFVLQAVLRSWWFDIPLIVPLAPMTSVAFMLFTLYMIPDPATTPLKKSHQALFGLAVAAMYGVLLVNNVVYGLFLALFLVCAARGALLYLADWTKRYRAVPLSA
jgi:enediyne biosynthesis protein E5